ncbi:MAG: amino acid ABC transporter ATP-binding protein [Trebonia sp.]
MTRAQPARSAVSGQAAALAVDIHNAHKAFGQVEVLRGIDLAVPTGTVTAVIGPSGSGKSTLLRAINHLEPLDLGYVSIFGDLIGVRARGTRLQELPSRAVRRQRARIGFVAQSFNLFPNLTAVGNVAEPLLAHKRAGKAEARVKAEELLSRVGVGDKAAVYPRQLSGGQQQRVAIARALALEPQLLLFDEPTSALDPELVGEVLGVIKQLAQSGRSLVIVTHEIGFAREVADAVVFIDGGVIVEQGSPPSLLDHPQQARTRDFLAKVL